MLCDELHTLVHSEQQATLVGKRQRPEIQDRINEQSVYTDIEVQNFDIEVETSISVYTDIEVYSFDIGKNFDIGKYLYRSSKLRYRKIFDIVTYRYRSLDL